MTARALRLVPSSDQVEKPEAAATALLELWAQWMRAGSMTAKTIETRTAALRALAGHAGQPDLTGFVPAQIVTWLADCRSQSTRYTYAVSARMWHRWLIEQGLRDDDPMLKVPKPPQPRGVPRPASDDALAAVLEVAGRRARAYILLAAYEGLRVHEIAKVRGDDFDGDGWMYVTGKGDVREAVPVHPLVQQQRRGWPEVGYWFPGRGQDHVSGNSVSATVSATFRRAGHRFTAHQLRHWFGTQVQRTTRDIRVTQELMRHASLQSTQIYTKVSGASKVAAVHRLGAVSRSAGPDLAGGTGTRPSG